jgi:hypothetical protein
VLPHLLISSNKLATEARSPDLGCDIPAVFGIAHGFLASSTEHSKKMLAPLKTRNMLRSDNYPSQLAEGAVRYD